MKLKKYVVIAGTITGLLFGTINPTQAASQFKDIPSSYPYKEAIDSLVTKGVISGYADGTFRPKDGVTRGQFAAFVARSLKLEASKTSFKDVTPSNSLYSEINKAASAGIINGYAGGLFKPNNPVTRADIAVMLDRALQLKGKFTQTAALSYSDYSKFKGGYADTSIKRMTFYGIMSAYNNNQFAPTVQGNRESTVLSIYNMLNVIEAGKPVDGITPPATPVVTKPYYEMTLAELKQVYGEKKMVVRNDQYKEGIITRDLIAEYYQINHGDKNSLDPNGYYNDPHAAGHFAGEYRVFYPEFEVISVNGVPFTDTNFYNPNFYDFEVDFILPKSPKEDGQFYIDLHTKKKDVATYTKGKAKMGNLNELSFVKDGALMVDIGVFSNIPLISISNDAIEYKGTHLNFQANSSKVTVNGAEKTLTTSIVLKNNRVMVPLRSFAEAINFKTYIVKGYNRIEITNYALETIEGLRE